tara:strand:+ start:160 stop:651 length:492 start_codon:yes stop_codon:yes gene_type:complete
MLKKLSTIVLFALLGSMAVASPKNTKNMLASSSPFCLAIATTGESISALGKKYDYYSYPNRYVGMPNGVVYDKKWGMFDSFATLFRSPKGACIAELKSKELRKKKTERWDIVASGFKAAGTVVTFQSKSNMAALAEVKFGKTSLTMIGKDVNGDGVKITLSRN